MRLSCPVLFIWHPVLVFPCWPAWRARRAWQCAAWPGCLLSALTRPYVRRLGCACRIIGRLGGSHRAAVAGRGAIAAAAKAAAPPSCALTAV
eukprot:COSAG01_NODE_720_length_14070_cov_9.960633_8_plen_92_part_00